ncbi:MAG: hypothetical protein KDB00_21720, partial [Planctomycetales bacterium]|nr:hypothetical protein [Planctomycetales bacterium]
MDRAIGLLHLSGNLSRGLGDFLRRPISGGIFSALSDTGGQSDWCFVQILVLGLVVDRSAIKPPDRVSAGLQATVLGPSLTHSG